MRTDLKFINFIAIAWIVKMIYEKGPERKDFFYKHTFGKSPQIPHVEGVVTRQFKYMRYIEHGYKELYDVKTDLKETKNLASDSRYAATLQALRKEYLLKKQAVK